MSIILLEYKEIHFNIYCTICRCKSARLESTDRSEFRGIGTLFLTHLNDKKCPNPMSKKTAIKIRLPRNKIKNKKQTTSSRLYANVITTCISFNYKLTGSMTLYCLMFNSVMFHHWM